MFFVLINYQGWIKYAKGCYLKVGGFTDSDDGKASIRNWNDARTFCKAPQTWDGADLAVLPNQFYQFFAIAATRGFGRHIWLGMQSTTQV